MIQNWGILPKGIYVRGDKSFFANLRFSTHNHAEILTSKGLGGIGNKFYAVVAPIMYRSDILNFTLGVLATEDNTKVTISGYKNGVRFSGIPSTPTSIEVTLNKGESYVLDGIGTYNKDGFIGAKIESNKPVSVTNGNFNGQYVSHRDAEGNSDIIMDQSVPIERLGREFVIVKGNVPIGRNMEGAIIVATKDNTQIFVNNEPSPIATLNEGQYFIIPDNKFVNQGREHYNLYVKSTENIYLYQLLGGANSHTPMATGGFNYIPPISCYLPNQIG